MCIYDKTNPLHKYPSNDASDLPDNVKVGKGLSEWENENTEGEFITELVIGGAKYYPYATSTGKTVIKQKGITMDETNYKIITFETMRYMVINNTSIKSEERYTFRWDAKSKNVITQFIGRSIRSTVNSKRTIVGYETLPFGYEQEESKQ
jgi:hypothetical protein